MATSPLEDTRDPSLALLLRVALESNGRKMHTGLPGRVESFDPDKQVVDVQPLVQAYLPNEDGSMTAVTLPVLSSIPVQFLGGGGFRGTFPLAQGDTGWISFSEASLDAWQAKGGLIDPADDRRFHVSDAVFLPGLHADDKPWKNVNSSDATWGKDDGSQVVATSDGLELGGNVNDRPTDMVALASLVKSELSSLREAVNDFVTAFNGHTHIGTMASACTAGGATGTIVATQPLSPAVPPQPVNDVKSAKVKSK